jgi:adenylate cyclase
MSDEKSGAAKAPRRGIPFGATLLSLMAVIVLPLAGALLFLGWSAVGELEERNINHHMNTLDTAVEGFLSSGLRVVVAIGDTLADTASFDEGGRASNEERLRQLSRIAQRYPAMAAVYAGYEDGLFLYAARSDMLSVAQRLEYDAPDEEAILLRTISGSGADRRQTAWFEMADGRRTPAQSIHIDYDPRMRPWYISSEHGKAPVMTEPYQFDMAKVFGVSVAVPLNHGGAVGFDFTLSSLSALVGAYRFSPNSVVMVAADNGSVFMESELCPSGNGNCVPKEADVRASLRSVIATTVGLGKRIERDMALGDRIYRVAVHPMPKVLNRRYWVASAVPLNELLAESHSLLERAAITASLAVLLAVCGVLFAAYILSRALANIADKTDRIRRLDFAGQAPLDSRIAEILRLSESVERMREGLEVFGRYVSKTLVHQIMRSPETAGQGRLREVTVMFTDIEGFSRIAETLEPELLTDRLSRYFDALGQAIVANRGMIDKYMGDAIMAFWNAPEPDPDHVANAVRAALQARDAGQKLAEKWRERGRPGFRTRFGLHAGPAVVGNVGARERINYTLVGAVANQASRLEGLNKMYGTEILASGEIAEATAGRFVWRHIDRVVAAGTTEEREIYQPLGEIDAAGEHATFLAQWDAAREAYREGRFDDARAGFQSASVLRPGDRPCEVFSARCEAFLRDGGPPAGWDGTWHFNTK